MRLYELKKALGELMTPLVLDRPDIKSLPVESLKAIKVAIEEHRADFEEIIDQTTSASHITPYLGEVRKQLDAYQDWFYENYAALCTMLLSADATEVAKAKIVKETSDQIDIFWLEPLTMLVGDFKEAPSKAKNDTYSEKKAVYDPNGYGRTGEHYISMRYVVQESPKHPGIPMDMVYDRIKAIINKLGKDKGVKISRFLAAAYVHGFLKAWPQHKALQREMGVTCSSPAVKKLSDNVDEAKKTLIGNEEPWLTKAIGELTANGPLTT